MDIILASNIQVQYLQALNINLKPISLFSNKVKAYNRGPCNQHDTEEKRYIVVVIHLKLRINCKQMSVKRKPVNFVCVWIITRRIIYCPWWSAVIASIKNHCITRTFSLPDIAQPVFGPLTTSKITFFSESILLMIFNSNACFLLSTHSYHKYDFTDLPIINSRIKLLSAQFLLCEPDTFSQLLRLINMISTHFLPCRLHTKDPVEKRLPISRLQRGWA